MAVRDGKSRWGQGHRGTGASLRLHSVLNVNTQKLTRTGIPTGCLGITPGGMSPTEGPRNAMDIFSRDSISISGVLNHAIAQTAPDFDLNTLHRERGHADRCGLNVFNLIGPGLPYRSGPPPRLLATQDHCCCGLPYAPCAIDCQARPGAIAKPSPPV